MIWQGAGVESLRLLADGLALGLHFLDILSRARLPRVHLPGERPVRTSHPDGVFQLDEGFRWWTTLNPAGLASPDLAVF